MILLKNNGNTISFPGKSEEKPALTLAKPFTSATPLGPQVHSPTPLLPFHSWYIFLTSATPLPQWLHLPHLDHNPSIDTASLYIIHTPTTVATSPLPRPRLFHSGYIPLNSDTPYYSG